MKFQKLSLKDWMADYDANSLYPSAKWDDNLVYPKLDTGYGFTPDLKSEIV